MEQNAFDDQLKDYFQRHKKEMKDDAFTQRVMQKLPGRRTHYYIIYLFLGIGILIYTMINGFGGVMITINDLSLSIPQMKLPFSQSALAIAMFLVLILSFSFFGTEEEDSVLSI